MLVTLWNIPWQWGLPCMPRKDFAWSLVITIILIALCSPHLGQMDKGREDTFPSWESYNWERFGRVSWKSVWLGPLDRVGSVQPILLGLCPLAQWSVWIHWASVVDFQPSQGSSLRNYSLFPSPIILTPVTILGAFLQLSDYLISSLLYSWFTIFSPTGIRISSGREGFTAYTS